MLNTFLFVALGICTGIIIAYFLFKRNDTNHEESGGLMLIQNQINELAKRLDKRMEESQTALSRSMNTQFSHIKDITESLVRLDETNKQVVNFAGQLQNLQDILKNPKQRGILGEYYLESVLKNVLPPDRYEMQYKFNGGDIVDAVIFLDKDKILPIDSKFSLENYNKIIEEKNPAEKDKLEKLFRQDLKNRIDETSKYIKPEEGTMEFAFMFIPSEAIYYDLLINQVGAIKASTKDLIEYAFQQKKVIIVSPTSFMAYLQTVLQGLRALQIEESAKEIKKRVEDLGKHLLNYDQYMKKVGDTLQTTVNHYNKASGEFKKIDKDVLRIGGEPAGLSDSLIEAKIENIG
ncbi:MAG TPA: DNA recombination protein RmuC [Candidatus Paceibacterota bacterium]|nr:DNA recombination protein RmuC [Candidatus Paceibacterota bacterium]